MDENENKIGKFSFDANGVRRSTGDVKEQLDEIIRINFLVLIFQKSIIVVKLMMMKTKMNLVKC